MARLFVQFPELPGFDDARTDYRRGFRDTVMRFVRSPDDAVLLLEPAPDRARRLRELWAERPRAEVMQTVPGRGRITVFAADHAPIEAVSADRSCIARFCGAAEPRSWCVDAFDLNDIASHHDRIAHLSLDPRWDVTAALAVPWQMVDAASIVIADAVHGDLEVLRAALIAAGLRPSGRAFGHARAIESFERATSPGAHIRRLVGRTRVTAGELAVRSREVRPDRLLPWRRDWVDPEPGHPLDAVPRGTVEEAIRAISRAPETSWEIPQLDETDPDATARACHSHHGVWPISFSYPELRPLREPSERLSSIIPGFPYAFDSDDAYLDHYARASMAITHRKAGWDCFRHVEILAAGATPVMIDAAEIPRFSMVHYPKAMLASIAARAVAGDGVPGPKTRAALRAHAQRHLTSEAMARYMLRMIDSQPGSVLFIDDQMPVNPEYQSALALIGLKAVLGARVDVAFPADFLYRGSPESATAYYGRGFGYSYAIDPGHRTPSEEGGAVLEWLDRLTDYDLVVVGSVERNPEWVPRVLDACEPSRIVLIHGEDSPPSPAETRWLRSTKAHVFVRAIHDRTRS